MKTIRPAELLSLVTADPNICVLDVRTPVEFAEAHAPCARNVPLDQLDPTYFHGTDSNIYLLCKSGARATKAAEKLTQAGFGHAVVVEGGTSAWIEAGLPIDRGVVRVISLERQVRIAAGMLVLTGVILAWLVNSWFVVISAFVGAGLIFAGVTDWCGMGLLLAKMPWNRKA